MRKTAFIILLLSAWLHAAGIPRPEYPQPQFQREDWMNLNGPWQFAFDDTDSGMPQAFPKTITVPFAPETAMSGIGDTAFHPVVWYRRDVDVPAGWGAKHVLLHFGAVDYRASVWVNGQLAGVHEGGNTPFYFDVTSSLKARKATIVVRAEDSPTDRFQPRGKQYWEPKSRSIWYTRTTGIWQTVWMEATGASYLDRVRITPSIDGNVHFDALVAHGAAGMEIQATIPGSGVGAFPVMGRRASGSASVASPKLWSVDSPNLYEVVLELKRGTELLDRVHSYFGFRSVGVKDGRVTLNGQPVYLKFVLDQGYWPQSTLTPPTDEAIQYDIRVTKEMGFNGARKHQKIEDPRFLYWADKMGFLVSGEMANAQGFDAEYAGAFTREWIEAVERDYNHPSIVIWAPINESWGVPRLTEAAQQSHLKALYELTRSLDQTRLVIDNEGWEHTASTDLFAFHDYTPTGDQLLEKVFKNLWREPDKGKKKLIPGYEYKGTPLYLSEFGGIAYIPDKSKVPQEAWGYSGVEKTADDALARLRSIYEAIAKTRIIAGICYTQLTDVEQEVNGLLTYDRKPKFDVQKIRAINDLLKD